MALESMVKVRLSGKEVYSPSTKQWAGAFLWCWKKRTDRRARSCGDVFGALARWAVAGCWLDAGVEGELRTRQRHCCGWNWEACVVRAPGRSVLVSHVISVLEPFPNPGFIWFPSRSASFSTLTFDFPPETPDFRVEMILPSRSIIPLVLFLFLEKASLLGPSATLKGHTQADVRGRFKGSP